MATHPTVKRALKILATTFQEPQEKYNSADDVKTYCQLQIAHLKEEVFCAVFMDAKLRLIANEVIAQGTITECNIHLRPLVRHCLEHNAESVIFYHNHPSGDVTPSRADIQITRQFKDFLQQIDVRVVDHIIVSPINAFSFTERSIN